jgi:hypothetical protein
LRPWWHLGRHVADADRNGAVATIATIVVTWPPVVQESSRGTSAWRALRAHDSRNTMREYNEGAPCSAPSFTSLLADGWPEVDVDAPPHGD